MSLKNLSAKIKIPKIFKDKLKNKRINLIYKRFEKSLNINENFGVAVSGGPDSLSLAFLTKSLNYQRNTNYFSYWFFHISNALQNKFTQKP